MLHLNPVNSVNSQGLRLLNACKGLIHLAQSIRVNASASIHRVFVGLFCAEHFTWQCLIRSCVASLLTVGCCFLAMVSVMGTGRIMYEFQSSASAFGQRIGATAFEFSPSEYLIWVLFVPFVMNVVADYLALYKTRKLINWIEMDKSPWKAGAAFFIDQAGTYVCFFAGLFVTSAVLVLGLLGISVALEGVQSTVGPILSTSGHVLHLVSAMNQPVVMIPCVVSTFFSSVWLWLYGLSILLSRLPQLG